MTTDLLKFRKEIDRANPELLRLLELLRSMAPDPQQITVRTALTCDTVNPWGNEDGQLERHSSGMYQGK
jgi:hypothetical protein